MTHPIRTAAITVTTILMGLVLSAGSASAQNDSGLTVSIDPPTGSVVLGERLDLNVTVTNGTGTPSAELIVHLDITDPAESTSVDPEDWTTTLSKPIGRLDPGRSGTATWTVQPIAGGRFAAYAVALSPGATTTAVSNVMTIDVADQRSLDPGGILPIAIGAPAAVGALLLAQIRLARRGSRPETRPAAA